MPIFDNLLSALGLERKARPAARPAAPGSSGPSGASSGAIPLSGWAAGSGYGTFGGYGSTSPIASPFADTVPWHLNPVVAAGIAWFARNFPVPDLHVVRDGGADDGAEIDGHDLPQLFDKPNELWSFFDFFAASVLSDITDGNTFWLKRKDGQGAVVDLWWLEPWGVRIVADPTRQKAILGYRYDSGDVHADYRPDEVLHVRAAQPDRTDPRRGMSPLTPVDRSIRVTTELCRYDEAILKNGGASPGVFAPARLDGPPIPRDDIGWLQSWYRQNATGPNAGSPIFAPFGLQFLKTGFSPEELSLDKLPKRHVSFILAALGLSPMVLGYEDDSKTYANQAESYRAAYENALMPMQARFAEAINHDDDLIAEGERLKWDYSHVTYLQDDRGAKIHSLVEAVGGGIFTVDESRAELGYEPMPEEEKPEPPQPPPVPGVDGIAGTAEGDGSADGKPAADALAALLAERGNGKPNGKPTNGKPAVKALPAPAGPPTDADLARRTEAVLVALEAKLGGLSAVARPSRKANPHHDQAGRFAPGSGGGHGGGAAPDGESGPLAPRVIQVEADRFRARVAALDATHGGRHAVEFGPPETAKDGKALARAEEQGRRVVVRATVTPDVETRTDGDATHIHVGGELAYSTLPNPAGPGHIFRVHHGGGRTDDYEEPTNRAAESSARAAVRDQVRQGTEVRYIARRNLGQVDPETAGAVGGSIAPPGHTARYRVLIPEGEPGVKGVGIEAPAVAIDGIEVPAGSDGAGGPPDGPFESDTKARPASGGNCGIGPGGFRAGNTCARGAGGKKPATKLVKGVQAAHEGGTIAGKAVHVESAKQENRVARAVGGKRLDDNEPADVVIGKPDGGVHALEVKTVTIGRGDSITVHPDALLRKVNFAAEHPNNQYHTVVLDRRDRFKGGAKDAYSGHEMYYRRGSGAYTLNSMHKVKDEAELKQLIDTPDHLLPAKAKGSLPGGEALGKLKVQAEKAHESRVRKDRVRKQRLRAERQVQAGVVAPAGG